MSEHHTILGGKVHVYRRPNSSSWQCASYLAGKNRHYVVHHIIAIMLASRLCGARS